MRLLILSLSLLWCAPFVSATGKPDDVSGEGKVDDNGRPIVTRKVKNSQVTEAINAITEADNQAAREEGDQEQVTNNYNKRTEDIRRRYGDEVYRMAWDSYKQAFKNERRERGTGDPNVVDQAKKGLEQGKKPTVYDPWSDFMDRGFGYNKMRYPTDPTNFAESGKEHLRKGRNEQAAADLGKAVKLGDRSEDTLAAYGSAAHKLGDFKLASKVSAMALEVNPANKSAMAVYKLSAGKDSTAKIPASLPELPAGALGAGSSGGAERPAVSAAGGTGSAGVPAGGREASPAVQKSATLTRQAASALNVHDYSSARDFATEAVQSNPQNAQAWNYRAIADNKLRYYQDAIRDASYSLNLAPGNSPALGSRAWALNKLGRYKEGLKDADTVLEINPDDPYAYQNKAFSLAGLGARGEMIESLRRSAELDPRFRSRYEKALQAPENVDVLFLFDDAPVAHGAAPAPPRRTPKKRFMFLSVNALLGGCLVALGLLHILSPGWKQKVSSTVRRFVGSSALPLPSAETPVTGAGPQSGFWNQYEVVRELGSGGMGVVFEARDRSLDRPVAIKKMREEIRLNPHERSRFMSEARTVATLHHPNIVDIYSVVEDSGEVYLVFEYVPGLTLSDVLRDNGPMSFSDAAGILRCACEAVDYAHKHKVIHRDIKPSNIMVSEDGKAKVMDFGVARQAKDSITKLSMVTNTVVGTPPYMAPEQEQGNVRPESDQYSLAIVFYEMLSGELPFLGQGAGMLLNKINGKHIPISQSAKNGVPQGLDAVLAKALHPDPDQRYRSAAELVSAVESLPA